MPARTEYSPEDYWSELAAAQFDESGVGYPELAVSFNRAMYRAMIDQTRRLLLDHELLDPPPERVLDLGSGTGIWIDFWRRLGAGEICGLDLTAAAVERLRARHPTARFEQADVGGDGLPVHGRFDVVSAMSVLLHITDEDRWRRALHNVASALKPGGHAVLIEPLVVHRWWGPPFGPDANSKARPLGEWRQALADAGLALLEVRPATVLLANPIDTRRRWSFELLSRYWDLLSRGIGRRESLGRAAGTLLSALDRPLRRLVATGPSAKLMLLRRSS